MRLARGRPADFPFDRQSFPDLAHDPPSHWGLVQGPMVPRGYRPIVDPLLDLASSGADDLSSEREPMTLTDLKDLKTCPSLDESNTRLLDDLLLSWGLAASARERAIELVEQLRTTAYRTGYAGGHYDALEESLVDHRGRV